MDYHLPKIRINKYIASCGVCSRRDADKLIEEGRVTVDGVVASQGMSVTGAEEICVDGKLLAKTAARVVYAFNKPVGVTCSERDPHAEKLITDYVKVAERVTYAGRLDKDSEGLILLTNDGNLIEELMRGSHRHEKEYVVRLQRPVTEDFLLKMSKGVYLEDLGTKTRPCKVWKTGEREFHIILTQGLNRQIRRMCRALGAHVDHLQRIRVANVTLRDLKPGEWRLLEGEELEGLLLLMSSGGGIGKSAEKEAAEKKKKKEEKAREEEQAKKNAPGRRL